MDVAEEIGKNFMENIREKLKNHDPNDGDEIHGEGSVPLPSDISPEQLQQLLDSLKGQLGGGGGAGQAAGGMEIGLEGIPGYTIHWSIYIFAFIILFGTVGWFSYKLVKSLKDKEKKKEDKKKLKEQKKKK